MSHRPTLQDSDRHKWLMSADAQPCLSNCFSALKQLTGDKYQGVDVGAVLTLFKNVNGNPGVSGHKVAGQRDCLRPSHGRCWSKMTCTPRP